MAKYVALLRGIMPMNPNMRNEKLRNTFEVLGFSNVQTVIASGNVLFETKSSAIPKLEKTIEEAMAKHLGFKSSVFIRSKNELESIIKKDPFKGGIHGRKTYLIVTFLKKKPKEIFNTINLEVVKTPDFMVQIEKKHGKENTTRTWKTIEKIVKKMN